MPHRVQLSPVRDAGHVIAQGVPGLGRGKPGNHERQKQYEHDPQQKCLVEGGFGRSQSGQAQRPGGPARKRPEHKPKSRQQPGNGQIERGNPTEHAEDFGREDGVGGPENRGPKGGASPRRLGLEVSDQDEAAEIGCGGN